MEKDKKKFEKDSCENMPAGDTAGSEDSGKAEEICDETAETCRIKEDECKSGENDQSAENTKEDSEASSESCDENTVPNEESSEGKTSEIMDEKYLRLMAEFKNYKRRTEKEREDIYLYANEKLMLDLLSVVDNFERALEQGTEDKKFLEGMEMIFAQLGDVLKASGLEEVKALGEDFDPNKHHAVMTEENPKYESGKVSEVIQKGYMLKEKVIRPSMVKVNK